MPDHDDADIELEDALDDAVPAHGYQLVPVVGVGCAEAGRADLLAFLGSLAPASGLAVAVALRPSGAGLGNSVDWLRQATVLPVRLDLVDAALDFGSRPDLMPVFQKQATTMPEGLVKTATSVAFPGINQALIDSMDQYLSNPSASTDSVIEGLTGGIEKALQA